MRRRERLVDALLRAMSRRACMAALSDRWRWRLEDAGFLSIYSRLVVVCGMARTGTTATVAYLATHPDVTLVVGGPQWFRAETDLVQGDIDWGAIDELLRRCRPGRVLVKRPWLERRAEFFERVSQAKVVVCYRRPETLFQSWYCSEMAGEDGKREPQRVYDGQLPFCDRLVAAGAMRMDQEGLGPWQGKRLGDFLGLDSAGFDPKRVERRWTGLRERDWLQDNSVWLKERIGDGFHDHSDMLPGRDASDDEGVSGGHTAVYEG